MTKKYMCAHCHYLYDEKDVTFDEMGLPMLKWGVETCCGSPFPNTVWLWLVEVSDSAE